MRSETWSTLSLQGCSEPRVMSPPPLETGGCPKPSVPRQYQTIFVAPAAAPSRTSAPKRSM